ncbi:MAG TPA: sigma-70 family RNA polymerase sigma factor [Candidatus Paceibacterota bacterium]|jgi:RNA polymerase sigma-70 factor (ECF subfamily)|nr:sigma-70 family RNA polymerase sigma factor [Candidatus Paceibacterota bacterium]
MEQSDEALIDLYRAGDDAAFVTLIERHFSSIYSYVYRFVRTVPAAEDVTQEVFIKVWRQLDRFKPGTGLRPWLFRIARNTAIDYLRKRQSIPLSYFEENDSLDKLTEDTTTDTLEEAMEKQDKTLLADAVQALPLHYKEVLLLRAEQDMTFEEIATTLGKPLNTVKSLYRRGLAQLHQIISSKRTN